MGCGASAEEKQFAAIKRLTSRDLHVVERVPGGEPSLSAEQRTVWVGGIPETGVEGPIGADGKLSAGLLEQFRAYGDVVSVTARVKEGQNKNWALVTYTVGPVVTQQLYLPPYRPFCNPPRIPLSKFRFRYRM